MTSLFEKIVQKEKPISRYTASGKPFNFFADTSKPQSIDWSQVKGGNSTPSTPSVRRKSTSVKQPTLIEQAQALNPQSIAPAIPVKEYPVLQQGKRWVPRIQRTEVPVRKSTLAGQAQALNPQSIDEQARLANLNRRVAEYNQTVDKFRRESPVTRNQLIEQSLVDQKSVLQSQVETLPGVSKRGTSYFVPPGTLGVSSIEDLNRSQSQQIVTQEQPVTSKTAVDFFTRTSKPTVVVPSQKVIDSTLDKLNLPTTERIKIEAELKAGVYSPAYILNLPERQKYARKEELATQKFEQQSAGVQNRTVIGDMFRGYSSAKNVGGTAFAEKFINRPEFTDYIKKNINVYSDKNKYITPESRVFGPEERPVGYVEPAPSLQNFKYIAPRQTVENKPDFSNYGLTNMQERLALNLEGDRILAGARSGITNPNIIALSAGKNRLQDILTNLNLKGKLFGSAESINLGIVPYKVSQAPSKYAREPELFKETTTPVLFEPGFAQMPLWGMKTKFNAPIWERQTTEQEKFNIQVEAAKNIISAGMARDLKIAANIASVAAAPVIGAKVVGGIAKGAPIVGKALGWKFLQKPLTDAGIAVVSKIGTGLTWAGYGVSGLQYKSGLKQITQQEKQLGYLKNYGFDISKGSKQLKRLNTIDLLTNIVDVSMFQKGATSKIKEFFPDRDIRLKDVRVRGTTQGFKAEFTQLETPLTKEKVVKKFTGDFFSATGVKKERGLGQLLTTGNAEIDLKKNLITLGKESSAEKNILEQFRDRVKSTKNKIFGFFESKSRKINVPEDYSVLSLEADLIKNKLSMRQDIPSKVAKITQYEPGIFTKKFKEVTLRKPQLRNVKKSAIQLTVEKYKLSVKPVRPSEPKGTNLAVFTGLETWDKNIIEAKGNLVPDVWKAKKVQFEESVLLPTKVMPKKGREQLILISNLKAVKEPKTKPSSVWDMFKSKEKSVIRQKMTVPEYNRKVNEIKNLNEFDNLVKKQRDSLQQYRRGQVYNKARAEENIKNYFESNQLSEFKNKPARKSVSNGQGTLHYQFEENIPIRRLDTGFENSVKIGERIVKGFSLPPVWNNFRPSLTTMQVQTPRQMQMPKTGQKISAIIAPAIKSPFVQQINIPKTDVTSLRVQVPKFDIRQAQIQIPEIIVPTINPFYTPPKNPIPKVPVVPIPVPGFPSGWDWGKGNQKRQTKSFINTRYLENLFAGLMGKKRK